MAEPAPSTFQLRIHRRGAKRAEPIEVHRVAHDDTERYRRLRIAHDSSVYSVNLEPAWAAISAAPDSPVRFEVTGFETIVKFGGTVQLKCDFVIEIEREAS